VRAKLICQSEYEQEKRSEKKRGGRQGASRKKVLDVIPRSVGWFFRSKIFLGVIY
jgi:hypothetical protein